MAPANCRARARFDAVRAMLADLDPMHRRVITLVYAYGTDAMSDATDENGRPLAGKPSGLVTAANNTPDRLGLLRVALAPAWGHGSFVRLALEQERALRAFEKRYPSATSTPNAVLDFLAYEAGRGDASARMFAELRAECEETRTRALVAFETARAVHHARAKQRRADVEAAERRAAEAAILRARAARLSGRVPTALRDIVGERRDRLRAAALQVLDALEPPREVTS